MTELITFTTSHGKRIAVDPAAVVMVGESPVDTDGDRVTLLWLDPSLSNAIQIGADMDKVVWAINEARRGITVLVRK